MVYHKTVYAFLTVRDVLFFIEGTEVEALFLVLGVGGGGE